MSSDNVFDPNNNPQQEVAPGEAGSEAVDANVEAGTPSQPVAPAPEAAPAGASETPVWSAQNAFVPTEPVTQAPYQAPAQPQAQMPQAQTYASQPYASQPYGQQPQGTAGAWQQGAQQAQYAAGTGYTMPANQQAGYGYNAQYGAQYGAPMQTGYPAQGVPGAQKSKVAAGLLGIFLGALGIHKFYLGYNAAGLVMLLVTLLTFGIAGAVTGIIGLVEGIIYLTMDDTTFYYTYEVNEKKWF